MVLRNDYDRESLAHFRQGAAHRLVLRGRRAVVTALLVMSLAGVMAGCQTATPRPSPREPSVVGVVSSVEFVGPRIAAVTLVTGGRVQIDLEAADRLYAGAPSEGDLLLYGSDAGGAWFVALPPSGEKFRIFTDLVPVDPGNTITFDFGLRLRLAQNYHEGNGPFEAGAQAIYDVNEKGEVTELE
jgi:hypothetical protein